MLSAVIVKSQYVRVCDFAPYSCSCKVLYQDRHPYECINCCPLTTLCLFTSWLYIHIHTFNSCKMCHIFIHRHLLCILMWLVFNELNVIITEHIHCNEHF